MIAILLPMPGLPNCSNAPQRVRTASTIGEAIGGGLSEDVHEKGSVQAVDRPDTAGTLISRENVLEL
jgi:hypothetical protein